jgi:HTH-type transcriptional regulator/antitoxin HigA
MTAALRWTRPRPLGTRGEYEAAVAEIERLLRGAPKRGTRAFDRLELLSILVEAYEEARYPIEGGTPQSMVAFVMEQKGVTRQQLAEWLGGSSRVSEFFRGRRPLSLRQIRILRAKLGIPADLLIA